MDILNSHSSLPVLLSGLLTSDWLEFSYLFFYRHFPYLQIHRFSSYCFSVQKKLYITKCHVKRKFVLLYPITNINTQNQSLPLKIKYNTKIIFKHTQSTKKSWYLSQQKHTNVLYQLMKILPTFENRDIFLSHWNWEFTCGWHQGTFFPHNTSNTLSKNKFHSLLIQTNHFCQQQWWCVLNYLADRAKNQCWTLNCKHHWQWEFERVKWAFISVKWKRQKTVISV